tara:strand:- start:11671 stop:11940 length:270 start_codon:yes stop_codon:yes gene_type:complete
MYTKFQESKQHRKRYNGFEERKRPADNFFEMNFCNPDTSISESSALKRRTCVGNNNCDSNDAMAGIQGCNPFPARIDRCYVGDLNDDKL